MLQSLVFRLISTLLYLMLVLCVWGRFFGGFCPLLEEELWLMNCRAWGDDTAVIRGMMVLVVQAVATATTETVEESLAIFYNH